MGWLGLSVLLVGHSFLSVSCMSFQNYDHMLFNIRLSERMLDCLLSFRIASLSIYRICTCIACIAPLNSVSRRICCNLRPLPYDSYAKVVYVTPKEMCLQLVFYGLQVSSFARQTSYHNNSSRNGFTCVFLRPRAIPCRNLWIL